MLRNLIKTSLRVFLKERAYTSINILGLTVGMTCAIFLYLYVQNELSYDKHFKDADNIYRVVSHITEPDDEFVWAVTQNPFIPEIVTNYVDVTDGVRFNQRGRQLYQYQDKRFYEERTLVADSNVFKVFSYELLLGDPDQALVRPNTIVVTESFARKYFGERNPLGESIMDGRNEMLEVTGVMRDVPQNSHLLFDALVSASTFPSNSPNWGGFGTTSYIKLPHGYNPADLEPALVSIVEQYVDPIFEQMGIHVVYELQRITDIHLRSGIQDDEAGGDMSYIYTFSAVALFILLIACINYMNLATARSSKRMREVGVRKVVGAVQRQLMAQFLTESILLSLAALALSLGLVYILLPDFNMLSGKMLHMSDVFRLNVMGMIAGASLLVGILSGAYPSFFLSRFKPIQVLGSSNAPRSGGKGLRRGLVILQFFISVVMLISTLIVYRQLDYLRSKDLGFNQEQVVMVNMSRDLRSNYEVFRNKLMQLSEVSNVGTSTTPPGENVGKNVATVEDSSGEMVERGVDIIGIDYDYVNTLGMEVVEGRNFERDFLSDTSGAALVNEAMVRRMNWDNAIGKRFGFGPENEFKVVGVIKDYHQNSLYQEIEPLFFYFGEDLRSMFIKLESDDLRASMASIESIWNETFDTSPFEYKFLDEDFNSQYQADEKRGQIFSIFTGLTVLIACLGLIGLASYSTEQRTREIGIRKAIGASRLEVVLLLSREFAALNVVAIILAIPIAYYFMNEWLQTFSYRIEMVNQVPLFILSGVLAIVVTFGAVGYHTIRAATANPVKSLREE